MKLGEFIQGIQGYYGAAYTDGQKGPIAKYLQGMSESALDILSRETLKRHTWQYKTLPDIAFWESIMPIVREQLARIEPTPDRLIEDKSEVITPEQRAKVAEAINKWGFGFGTGQ